MLVGIVAVSRKPWMRNVFFGGLAIASGLALIGSILELVSGNVCPRVGSVPMCYISLAMTVLTGVLFWKITRT